MAKGGGRLVQAQKAAKKQHHLAKKQKTSSTIPKPPPTNPQKKKAPQPKSHTAPTIPFSPSDRILLLGEGDLSFAASLATHHHCTALTATVLDASPAALLAKYPHAQPNIDALSTPPHRLLYSLDALKHPPFTVPNPARPVFPWTPARVGAFDRIVFNFPHVGGRSTDVNRQVRANQELLVGFFGSALKSLAPGGKVVVTLFEGEPYTLWNVRDLARHAGLAVERSFRFQAEAYPGYRHARTLGVVRREGGKGEEARGAWRGEERAARSYVFGWGEEGSDDDEAGGEGEGGGKDGKGEPRGKDVDGDKKDEDGRKDTNRTGGADET
ncbi:hypothetical protein B0T18DRAFT_433992 [Schizothecium vesticola]|uniref:25S rRNA (uridine-N(3))-methyltransferase BMT5-like domain-containing protein n=1 Tax=Schizothecium vesticola TaxID=314040 RepID=A0AA40F9E4_9PEZI|nr:hypothetical protein B0T18DRAFT_433992 [Schizothecium vesticola]